MSKEQKNPVTVAKSDSTAGGLATPTEAFTQLDADSKAAGGAWQVPLEDVGGIARKMFDAPTSEDGTVTILLPGTNIDGLPAQALVRIQSKDKRVYLGAIVGKIHRV